jgi:hypothetical protein
VQPYNSTNVLKEDGRARRQLIYGMGFPTKETQSARTAKMIETNSRTCPHVTCTGNAAPPYPIRQTRITSRLARSIRYHGRVQHACPLGDERKKPVARLNLTIPDSLHDRLEKHRDELNLSKLVAEYLVNTIDELENTPKAADPDIQRLVTRLQSTYDRWYSRGYYDGRKWAVNRADREEFEDAAKLHEMTGVDIVQEMSYERRFTEEGEEPDRWSYFPTSFDLNAEITAWQADDLDAEGNVIQLGNHDKEHYLEGWRDAVSELWSEVEPLLKKVAINAKSTARKQAAQWEEGDKPLPF